MKTKLLILALFVTLKISGQTIPQYGLYTERGKDGLVKFYNRGVLTSEGKYNDREKVGVWTGYTRGFERLKYDFSTNQLILYVRQLLILYKDTRRSFRLPIPFLNECQYLLVGFKL